MTINQIINYPHGLIHNFPHEYDVTGIHLIKSKHYLGMYYAVRGDTLITMLDDFSLARAAARLAHALYYNKPPFQVEQEMYDEEVLGKY